MKQPAVAAMDHNHLHTAQPGHLRRIGKTIHYVVYRFFIQRGVIFSQVPGGVAGRPDWSVVIFRIRPASGMKNLDCGNGIVAPDGVSCQNQGRHNFRIIQSQAQEMGYSCFQVNSGLSHIDNGGASFGLSFKYGNVIRGKVSLGGQIGHRHRSRFNPVF